MFFIAEVMVLLVLMLMPMLMLMLIPMLTLIHILIFPMVVTMHLVLKIQKTKAHQKHQHYTLKSELVWEDLAVLFRGSSSGAGRCAAASAYLHGIAAL
jgi:hypothetical protein